MWTRVFFILVNFCFVAGLSAQQGKGVLTLQQSIETALNNNLQVKQAAFDAAAAEVNQQQAKANLFPTLQGNINHGINQGRSIDPFTNAYVNQQINFASYGVNSSVILFNGGSFQNALRSNTYASKASRLELQQVKDNLTLNTVLAYLQVLNNEDQVALAKTQVAVTQQQIDRLEVLNKQGAIAPPTLYELRGQLKNNELTVLTAQNALETAKLSLEQIMNVPYDPALKLERIPLEESLVKYESTADEVYEKAVDQMALVKATEWRTRSAQSLLKAAKGQLYPTLFLSGNVNSNYSSAATRDVLLNTSETPTNNYVLVNGSKFPVMVQQSNFESQKIAYNNQLKNNLFSSISVGVQIPVFNSLQARNRVKLARISMQNYEAIEENTRLQLRREIDGAFMNLTNAWERYKTSLEAVSAYAEAFRAAEVRFNAGVGTPVDYILAKNNLDRVSLSLVAAKYDYVLRRKVLDYYSIYKVL